MGVYVTRDGEGRVVCRFATPRFPEQEYLADDSSELAALRLGDAKAVRLRALDAEFARQAAAGFDYDGVRYQLDPASQANITALATRAGLVLAAATGASWPEGFAYIAADNSTVAFTAESFVPFADAAANRVIALRLRFRALKETVIAAADAGALATIDITEGWD